MSTRQHARIGHHVRTRSRRTPRGILLRHRRIRGERLRWKRTLRGGVTDEPPPLNPRGVLVTPRAPYGLTPSSGPQPPPPPRGPTARGPNTRSVVRSRPPSYDRAGRQRFGRRRVAALYQPLSISEKQYMSYRGVIKMATLISRMGNGSKLIVESATPFRRRCR